MENQNTTDVHEEASKLFNEKLKISQMRDDLEIRRRLYLAAAEESQKKAMDIRVAQCLSNDEEVFLPLVEQKLVCNLEFNNNRDAIFEWVCMNGLEIINSGKFYVEKPDKESPEETKRFLEILNDFDGYQKSHFLDWYSQDRYYRSKIGIVLKRPFVCWDVSNTEGTFHDVMKIKKANAILADFSCSNAFVNVYKFRFENKLQIRIIEDDIHFIITVALLEGFTDILAVKDGNVIGTRSSTNFFNISLKNFIDETKRNYNYRRKMEEKIINDIQKACKDIIEKHLFEDVQQGKEKIEEEVNSYLDSLVGSKEISSFELRCKIVQKNNIYVEVVCSKDNVFHELELQILTSMKAEN